MAPKPNQWKFTENPGQPKAYKPDDLWKKALEYFEWCESHPWHKNEAIKGGEQAGTIIQIPTATPFTLKGLCIFANISFTTFDNYSKKPEYVEITTRIREICYTQKFEGAAVGAFNANLIARDLGLTEKTDLHVEGQWDITMNINGENKVHPSVDSSIPS